MNLLVFSREWSRRWANLNEICTLAEAQRYEVTLLRIINVQLCEKLRYVAKADVVLLTHGSDYFIAAMARARCLWHLSRRGWSAQVARLPLSHSDLLSSTSYRRTGGGATTSCCTR